MTKADWDRSRKEGEVTYIARDNPTWITNAYGATRPCRCSWPAAVTTR